MLKHCIRPFFLLSAIKKTNKQTKKKKSMNNILTIFKLGAVEKQLLKVCTKSELSAEQKLKIYVDKLEKESRFKALIPTVFQAIYKLFIKAC